MTKEKVQAIFMYIATLAIIAVIGFFVFYFISGYMRWQGYKNDPNKKTFIEMIEKVNSKKSKSADDYLDLGNSYSNLGELKKAERCYKKSIEMVFNTVAVKNLASVYVDMKEYKKAEDSYFKALDSAPNQTDVYMKLSDLYRNHDWVAKRSDRLGILLTGLEKNKDSIDIMVALASFYKESGDLKKSIEYFNKALEKDPDNEAIKSEIEEIKLKI